MARLARARGTGLIEGIFYIGILVFLTLMVVQTLVPLGRAFRSLSAMRDLDITAQTALERMSRDIRGSTSVDTGASTLDSSPGLLKLNTTTSDGTPTTVAFSLSSSTLNIIEAGVDIGAITSSSTRITTLTFSKITTTNSQAVKIQMIVESGTSTTYRTKTFYTTVVLRNSYPIQ